MILEGPHILKGANTVEEAVAQFYDNPDKYSQDSALGKSNPVNPAKAQSYLPPAYAPPASISSRSRHRPHTNAVIEAGNVRARDEVGINPSHSAGDELTCSPISKRCRICYRVSKWPTVSIIAILSQNTIRISTVAVLFTSTRIGKLIDLAFKTCGQ